MKKRYTVPAIILGAILFAEMVARMGLGLGDPPLSIAHPTIEYLYRPNQDVIRFGKRFIVNEYGVRSESFPRHKAEGELRIMVFGDSVLNGGSLTDHEELATTLLARRLKTELGRSVTIGNISAGSWGPGNWLAYAKEYGFFEADAVVLVISSHDAADNPTFVPLDPDTHPQGKPVLALVEGMTRYLPRYLPKWRAEAKHEPSQEEIAAATRRGLADLGVFLDLARAHTRWVLVLQHPERKEIESGRFEPGHAAIQKVAAEHGVPVIQLAPAFASAMRGGEQPWRDNIHPNEIGQRILASVLRQALIDQRMLGSSGVARASASD